MSSILIAAKAGMPQNQGDESAGRVGFIVSLCVEHVAESPYSPGRKECRIDACLETQLGHLEVNGRIKMILLEPFVELAGPYPQFIHSGFDGIAEGEDPVDELVLFWSQANPLFSIRFGLFVFVFRIWHNHGRFLQFLVVCS